MISTSLTGGAGNAAYRLHSSLRSEGVASRFWSKSIPPGWNDPSCRVFAPPETQHGWLLSPFLKLLRVAGRKWAGHQLRRQLRGRPPGLEIFSGAAEPWATPFRPIPPGDVLHLHWIARMVDYASFFASLPDDLPIVWTLHDQNPLTGGCHYSYGCERFIDGCGQCPQLGKRGAEDLSRRTFAKKLAALRRKNLHVVAPSTWLLAEAQRSPLLAHAHSFQRIPYGIDVGQFAPEERLAARKAWGIDPEIPIIGMGAESLTNRRKGMHLLASALALLGPTSRYLGLAFGSGDLRDAGLSQFPVRHLGILHGPAELRRAYAAMDFFVLPSTEENLAQTGLEAMACGVPVIGFRAGGTADFVRPNRTGLLARTGDAADLAQCIGWMLEHDEAREAMSQQARAMMCAEFNAQQQARTYLELYQRIGCSANCRVRAA